MSDGNKSPLPELLTTREVASLFRVCRATVHDWSTKGRLPAIRVNRRLRFDRAQLLGLIKRGGLSA